MYWRMFSTHPCTGLRPSFSASLSLHSLVWDDGLFGLCLPHISVCARIKHVTSFAPCARAWPTHKSGSVPGQHFARMRERVVAVVVTTNVPPSTDGIINGYLPRILLCICCIPKTLELQLGISPSHRISHTSHLHTHLLNTPKSYKRACLESQCAAYLFTAPSCPHARTCSLWHVRKTRSLSLSYRECVTCTFHLAHSSAKHPKQFLA